MNARRSHLITGVFYRYKTIGRPFVRPSFGRSVGPLVGRLVGRSVRPVFRAQQHRLDPIGRYWPRRPVHSAVLRIFMGAKVKLVAYRVHLLIKYLLTKGNT